MYMHWQCIIVKRGEKYYLYCISKAYIKLTFTIVYSTPYVQICTMKPVFSQEDEYKIYMSLIKSIGLNSNSLQL